MKKSYLRVGRVGHTTILFVIICLLFGLVIVKGVPPFWGYDESAHFGRAYQISEGQLLPKKLPNSNYGGYVPANAISLDLAAHLDLYGVASTPILNRQDFKHQAIQKVIAARSIDQSQKKAFDFPGSAVYSPVAYIAPSAGILTCRIADCSLGNTILIARTFSLIAYVVVVAFSIWLLRTKKIKWLVFVIGLLPMAVFQTASVSADGPVIALSLLLFAILVKAISDKKLSPFLVGVLVLTAISIPLIKINYGFLDLGIVPTAILIFKNKRKALIYTAAFVAMVAIVALGWLYIARGPSKAISTLHAPNPVTHAVVSVKQQSRFVLHKPFEFAQVLVRTTVLRETYWAYTTTGEFALNSVPLPLSAVVLAYLILVSSVFYAKDELMRYKRLSVILGCIAVLTALSILGTLYLTFTPVGGVSIDGVQGRYFIPLIPFFLAGIAAVIPIKILMSPKTAAILFSVSSCALLLSGVIYYGLATY